jgi:hypothetical protein
MDAFWSGFGLGTDQTKRPALDERGVGLISFIGQAQPGSNYSGGEWRRRSMSIPREMGPSRLRPYVLFWTLWWTSKGKGVSNPFVALRMSPQSLS